MPKYKFEYIWTDGCLPVPGLRGKTKILDLKSFKGNLKQLPTWNFDGSSTQQAEGFASDCLLKPVSVYPDPTRENGFIVLSEVLNPDGKPHVSNSRARVKDDKNFWFGFEQEYVLMFKGKPIGFPTDGFPAPQGPYYCSVGSGVNSGRELVEEHMDMCIEAGLGITGVNAEVMLGQWEYQIFGKGALKAADDLMISRYLLQRLTEKYGVEANLHPKPVRGDWNGSGMHANFSNKEMREKGGEKMMTEICQRFSKTHNAHIAVYGADNDQRLTGRHETQSIDKFSFGVSDRGASIRIPVGVAMNKYKGYLEDRRPASNADPYEVVSAIMTSVKGK